MAVGHATTGLRSDPRQWLIYDDETQGAVVRGIEILALTLAGRELVKSARRPIRAVGFFMIRVAEARTRIGLEAGGVRGAAIERIARLVTVAAGEAPYADIAGDVDEIYATIFNIDEKAHVAGVHGPGRLRDLIRGD